MKTIITLSQALMLLINLNMSFALDTNVVKFLPQKIGNIWVYHVTTTTPYYTNQYERNIIDSTIMYDGHKYFRYKGECKYVSGYPPCGPVSYGYSRIDSTTGVIYDYQQGINWCPNIPNLLKIDSLQASLHDTAELCTMSDYTFAVLSDTMPQTVLNHVFPARFFVCDYFEHYLTKKYAKNIGMYDYYSSGVIGAAHTFLVGCVINGIVYGDTTFTLLGLEPSTSEIPEKFSLSQNYPNPFNPRTIINFQLPMTGNVKLIIYDVLGHEAAVLVNKQLKPGKYEVEWDGTDFPSGVYLYRLSAGDFRETKKLVLLK